MCMFKKDGQYLAMVHQRRLQEYLDQVHEFFVVLMSLTETLSLQLKYSTLKIVQHQFDFSCILFHNHIAEN